MYLVCYYLYLSFEHISTLGIFVVRDCEVKGFFGQKFGKTFLDLLATLFFELK